MLAAWTAANIPPWMGSRRFPRNPSPNPLCWYLILAVFILTPLSLAAMERHSDPDGCFSCHGLPGLEFIDENGVRRVATILQKDYYVSLHGSVPCRDCHRKIQDYPHDPKNGYVDCSESCHLEEPSEGKPFSHKDIVKEFKKSVHGSGKKAGATDGFHGGNRLEEVDKEQNPSCRRCHYNEPYLKPEQMARFQQMFNHVDSECGSCHQGEVWRNQFGGHILRRLIGKHYSKQDANAMCISCHGDRAAMKKVKIEDPETKALKPAEPRFLFVVDSYRKMLHGRLLEVNVEDGAACLDCHAPEGEGYRHGIQRDEKTTASTHPDHLPDTCGQAGCHEGYAHNSLSKGFLLTDVHDLNQVRLDKLLMAGIGLDHLNQSGWITALAILGPLSGIFLIGSLAWWFWPRKEAAIPLVGGIAFQKEMLEMNPPPPAWKRWWDNITGNEATSELPPTAESSTATLTILYGSQTGNGEGVAQELAGLAESWQLPFRLVNMAEFAPRELAAERFLYIIVSTQGEGEPPITAQTLHAWLKELADSSHATPLFPHLNYAVFGLGDSSYQYFCQCGKDFDAYLEKLGAQRILPRVDADVDYEEPARDWMAQVIESYQNLSGNKGVPPKPEKKREKPEATYGKHAPFLSLILANRNLNRPGSAKETRHIEFNLEDSGLSYQVGDVAGIYPKNNPAYVETLLQGLGLDGYQEVLLGGETMTLREALYSHLDITTLTRPLMEKYGELCGNEDLNKLLKDPQALNGYLWGRQILDFFEDFPVWLEPQAFVSLLRSLAPRLYSIASSPNAHPGQVHLTIGVVRFKTPTGRLAEGVCSNYLARTEPGHKAPLYIQANPHFHLPADPATPIIMVGPGTGIAPFRAFVEEREISGGSGKNWLFFGDQHRETDFLYEEEWLDKLERGVLTRLDLAFSRDQAQRIYVQHRMRENAADLYAWLEEGAYFYVCGDASRMAKDVHQTLLEILMQEGKLSEDNATAYLKTMEQSGRYQRDVY